MLIVHVSARAIIWTKQDMPASRTNKGEESHYVPFTIYKKYLKRMEIKQEIKRTSDGRDDDFKNDR
jgi:hypothetical protein